MFNYWSIFALIYDEGRILVIGTYYISVFYLTVLYFIFIDKLYNFNRHYWLMYKLIYIYIHIIVYIFENCIRCNNGSAPSAQYRIIQRENKI